jgi:hypothetical protein
VDTMGASRRKPPCAGVSAALAQIDKPKMATIKTIVLDNRSATDQSW